MITLKKSNVTITFISLSILLFIQSCTTKEQSAREEARKEIQEGIASNNQTYQWKSEEEKTFHNWAEISDDSAEDYEFEGVDIPSFNSDDDHFMDLEINADYDLSLIKELSPDQVNDAINSGSYGYTLNATSNGGTSISSIVGWDSDQVSGAAEIVPDSILQIREKERQDREKRAIEREKKRQEKLAQKKKDQQTWKRSNKVPNTPFLFIGDDEQLPLEGTQIAVTVEGFRARVLIDCFFYNTEERQREGTFKMRLPQGASPYYFAFGESVYSDKRNQWNGMPFVDYEQIDFSPEGIENMRSATWKQPKKAKVVEKKKAAFAYTSVVKRRVDPALAEFAGADLYNCRVFPLAPKKLHRIVMGYDVNLTQLDEDWLMNFSIPDIECTKVVDFEIAEFPGIQSNIKPSQKTEINYGYKTFQLTNPKEKEIEIRYNELGNVLLGSDDHYFGAAVKPELPQLKNEGLHSSAIFALDVSLSANPDKFNIWLNLLEETLNNNQDVIKDFKVVMFNVESFWWKNEAVANNASSVKAFMRYANSLSLEGASDVGLVLSEISQKSRGEHNIFLLSDGAITWGISDHYQLSDLIQENDILYAFNTGISGTSVKTLQHLSQNNGGAIFSIANEDEIKDASVAFRNQAWRIESIEIKNASDILIAGRPEYIYSNQKLIITGRNKKQIDDNVVIKVSLNGEKRTLNIPFKNTLESSLTERIYGQIATEQLEEFRTTRKKEAISYAKHFRVPGRSCSLLMLESEADYKQYDIDLTEDLSVVNKTSVNELIDEVFKNIGTKLGSAKEQFISWINDLEKTPGVKFNKTKELDKICKQLKEADFQVPSKGLNCKARTKSYASSHLRKNLNQSKLDYNVIIAEALKRKEKYGTHDALKLMSSLVEKNPGDGVMARDVAYSALEWDLNEQAYYLLKRVLDSRPFEPQTYHAIAQALEKSNKKELALVYYEIATNCEWENRFGEFDKIVKMDYLNFLRSAKDELSIKDFALKKIKSLEDTINEKDAELLVTIAWNTDNTDIDLHVKEPTGEFCNYQNRKTELGGTITNDVTAGYGPEMYMIQDAKKGKYEIQVNYFSSDANRTSTRTKVYATIYKNWGKENEEVIKKVITLKEKKDMHDVITIRI